MLDRLTGLNGRGARRAAICLLLSATMAGCASWRVADRSPQEVFAAEHPTRVRVTTNDGEQTVLRRPRVLGDVLAGFDDACLSTPGFSYEACQETGIPVFEIAVLELRERGLAVIILPAVAGLLGVWLLANR